MSSVDHAEVMHALEFVHRQELAEMKMKLARYRVLLEEHGIEPPDLEAADFLEMWRECARVIDMAHGFVERLGPSKELLAGPWR